MPSPGLEPRVPCPPVFINEPFPNYPPCPSLEPFHPISIQPLMVGVSVFIVILLVLAGMLLLSLLVGSMD